jgi:hypothetical protein
MVLGTTTKDENVGGPPGNCPETFRLTAAGAKLEPIICAQAVSRREDAAAVLSRRRFGISHRRCHCISWQL